MPIAMWIWTAALGRSWCSTTLAYLTTYNDPDNRVKTTNDYSNTLTTSLQIATFLACSMILIPDAILLHQIGLGVLLSTFVLLCAVLYMVPSLYWIIQDMTHSIDHAGYEVFNEVRSSIQKGKWNTSAIFLILILTLPLVVYNIQDTDHYTIDPRLMLPDDNRDGLSIVSKKGNEILIGFMSEDETPEDVLSTEGFSMMHQVIRKLTSKVELQLKNVVGISTWNETFIAYDNYSEAMSCDNTMRQHSNPCTGEERILQRIAEEANGHDDVLNTTSTIASLTLDCDLFTMDGVDYLKYAREVIDDVTDEDNGFRLFLYSLSAVQYDIMDELYDVDLAVVFPLVLFVIFVLLGWNIDSFVAPVRSFLTSLLSVCEFILSSQKYIVLFSHQTIFCNL